MNKTQIIINELQQINTHCAYAELKAKNNLSIARQDADFADIDAKIRKLKLDLSKTDDLAQIKKINTSIASLQKKLPTILSKLGLSLDSLTPQYACPICHDTGYDNGSHCACLTAKVKAALAKQCGLQNNLQYSFATSDPKLVESDSSLKKAYAVAQKYVANFPNFKYPNLVFVGNVGAGKTYLIQCIANALIERGNYVTFSTAFDLNRTIQNSFGTNPQEREAMLAPFFESDLLIIDDLGSEPIIKNVTLENLFCVINERQSRNLPIIISTNLNLEELQERYGDRLASRIFNKRINLLIPFLGKDLRVN